MDGILLETVPDLERRRYALLQAAATIYASVPFAAARNAANNQRPEDWFRIAVDQASALLVEIETRESAQPLSESANCQKVGEGSRCKP